MLIERCRLKNAQHCSVQAIWARMRKRSLSEQMHGAQTAQSLAKAKNAQRADRATRNNKCASITSYPCSSNFVVYSSPFYQQVPVSMSLPASQAACNPQTADFGAHHPSSSVAVSLKSSDTSIGYTINSSTFHSLHRLQCLVWLSFNRCALIIWSILSRGISRYTSPCGNDASILLITSKWLCMNNAH